MSAIEELERAVRAALPGARSKLDRPGDSRGTWWLDVTHKGNSATVEWRPGGGFGVSSSEGDGFEGSDERHATTTGASNRVIALLTSGERTRPPRVAALPELRATKAISQAKLAKTLGVNQAQVSKLERQDNMLISTLQRLVGALGGVLEIRARFQDEPGDVIISGPWSRVAKAGAKSGRRKAGRIRRGPGAPKPRR